MTLTLRMLVGVLCLAGLTAGHAATNVAQVRLHGTFVQMNPVTVSEFPANDYTLAYYSGFDPGSLNGEFYLSGDPNYTLESGFQLQITMNAFPLDPIQGAMWVLVPEAIDADGDAMPDFYEVDQEVPSTSTTGEFVAFVEDGETGGTITTRWSRPAGSRTGQCVITFAGSDLFAGLPEFTHTFEIAQYNGTFRYVPGAGLVTGMVEVRRLDHADGAFSGPLVLTNNAGVLAFENLTWTNAQGQPLSVSVGDLEREPTWPTIYYGAMAFMDGDPNTFEVDYELFYMELEDPNDGDGDGIPDVGDPPGDGGAAPSIVLRPAGASLELVITGTVGRGYQIQMTTGLGAAASWTPVQSVTLSQASQPVPLALPGGATAFWRVQAL